MSDMLSIIAGLVFLFLGGEGLIRGSVTIAEKLKLSTLLISTVIIGFGTSMPELLVSLDAVLTGYPEIALGNVVGSNISNTLLILGSTALLATIPCHTKAIKRDAFACMAASGFLALLSFSGYINRLTGLAMLSCLIAYLTYIIWHEKSKNKQKKQKEKEKSSTYKDSSFLFAILIALFSLILLPLGAHLLVNGAVSIANAFGISEAVIGLTLVAVGTSLPEMVTAYMAFWRKYPEMVIGNILGSNLFNILSILGITAVIKPIPFIGQIAHQDVWIMFAISVLLVGAILSNKKISRFEGLAFLLLYAGYISWLFM